MLLRQVYNCLFNPEWRKREPAKCAGCGTEFLAVSSEIRRGKGRTCSLSCAASLSADLRRSQRGELNPNWRGGVSRDLKYRESKRRYRARHPEKAEAHMIVRDAIRCGTLVRSSCEVCGSDSAEGHHDDYTKPLVVRWLCKKHHTEHHRLARAA